VQERDDRQASIRLAGCTQLRFVEADEIRIGYARTWAGTEKIAGEYALRRVKIGHFVFAPEAQVIPEDMFVAGHVGIGIGETVEHVVVDIVPIRRIVIPEIAVQVMIGIEAAGLVADGHAELNGILRYGAGHLIDWSPGIAAGLEAVAVAFAGKLGRISIVESPAMIEDSRLVRIDAIVPVIAVEPRTASPKRVPGAARIGMTPESIGIASTAILRKIVKIAVGVTVQDQVI